LILGIQWLSILGTIKWDFKHLKMEFKQGNRNLILRGIKEGTVQFMSQESLPKAIENATQLFVI